ncbi:hypothetical protein MPER_06601, partial [Moniliophthora perniciosa FA553]
IGICFSMTDVFRSQILAVVMQQIVDEPTLPVLFLRTVIQAVTTYKSLLWWHCCNFQRINFVNWSIKQPSLKAGLREYVTKKAPNKARVSGFLDIFADASENGVAAPQSDQAQSADST